LQFNFDSLVLLGLLGSSIHWIVARSHIMRPFWGSPRLPMFLRNLLACAACSGFWLGLGLGSLGVRPASSGLAGVLLSGLLGVFVVPVFEGALLWGLQSTHLD
jgi:hypothetical protein